MKLPEKTVRSLLPFLAALVLAAGCGTISGQAQSGKTETAEIVSEKTEINEGAQTETEEAESAKPETEEAETAEKQGEAESEETSAELPESALPAPGLPAAFDQSKVPVFKETVWADVNGDIPFFTEKEMEDAGRMTEELEQSSGEGQLSQICQAYGNLDALGRCTGACALVGTETLPQEERGNIGMVRPTGWHTVKYDGIDGNYLYNRCHLIGFQLTGQDANEKNLITGTRFMNIEGMLPYEDSVLAYVKGTGNHVLYRVTPVFQGGNLLADGVLMEARSVEDPLVQFCVFCYNVQPGITIDYASGESSGPAFTGSGADAQDGDGKNTDVQGSDAKGAGVQGSDAKGADVQGGESGTEKAQDRSGTGEDSAKTDKSNEWNYIVNVSSRKFHRPDCESVEKMSQKNKQGYKGSREELIEMGYEPCKNCNP